MELAMTADIRDVLVLNEGKRLVIGGRYKVRRSDGGTEEGWRLTIFGPNGKLVLTKEVSTKSNCQILRI